jgi:hypothetical protein
VTWLGQEGEEGLVGLRWEASCGGREHALLCTQALRKGVPHPLRPPENGFPGEGPLTLRFLLLLPPPYTWDITTLIPTHHNDIIHTLWLVGLATPNCCPSDVISSLELMSHPEFSLTSHTLLPDVPVQLLLFLLPKDPTVHSI